jgi:hypothetical protein
MKRFTEQTAAYLAHNYFPRRFAQELAETTQHPDGYICQNCDRVVERVTLVPEFNYYGCDDCMEEALKQIAREQLRKPARIERVQGELFPEVA